MPKAVTVVQIRMPTEMIKLVDKIARERLMSRSDIMREALLRYLKKEK